MKASVSDGIFYRSKKQQLQKACSESITTHYEHIKIQSSPLPVTDKLSKISERNIE